MVIFKGYILSREKWAHLDIAPYKNQEGDPFGEPLTYLLLTVSPTCLVFIVTIINKQYYAYLGNPKSILHGLLY